MTFPDIHNLVNLDLARKYMLLEVNSDESNDKLYLSNRLSSIGKKDYPNLLKQAITKYNDGYLANELQSENRFNAFETIKNGVTRKINIKKATEMLASSEFNRFYIRGLCLYAKENGISYLTIYRARDSRSKRSESENKINEKVDPDVVLENIRTNIGYEKTTNLIFDINSGLSVKLD